MKHHNTTFISVAGIASKKLEETHLKTEKQDKNLFFIKTHFLNAPEKESKAFDRSPARNHSKSWKTVAYCIGALNTHDTMPISISDQAPVIASDNHNTHLIYQAITLSHPHNET